MNGEATEHRQVVILMEFRRQTNLKRCSCGDTNPGHMGWILCVEKWAAEMVEATFLAYQPGDEGTPGNQEDSQGEEDSD